MLMNRPCLAAFIVCALLAFAARAQDPKKAEPAPASPAAVATPDPAAKPPPRPGDTPDPQIIDGIMTCLAEGLSQNWRTAWFVIKETERDETTRTRQFKGDFFFSTSAKDLKGRPLRTCGAEQIIQGVGSLNDYLAEDKQDWTSATFTFMRDGKYEVKYDYTPFKPQPAAKPAAKATSRKKQEAAK